MNIVSILALVFAFCISVLIAPLIINFAKRAKASQTILKYVEEHKGKQGTPTLGGLIFIIASFVCSIIFFKQDYLLSIVCLFTMLAFGILGFLDDFIKVKYKQNEGLKPYQKIIGQLGISIIISIFAYKSNLIGTEILIPFTDKTINLSWGIIPVIIFIYLATVNSVNLIDGLDGLCSSVSIAVIFGFSMILMITSTTMGGAFQNELTSLQISNFALIGALFGFLCFNIFPAKIFMGDTGSLALGGYITTLAVVTRQELLIPILGIMFVLTVISDILQVAYYKKTKKRIFLMAPLHHHFQKKGIHENKIVFIYFCITLFIGFLTYIIYVV